MKNLWNLKTTEAEEKILKFWKEKKIFEKSVRDRPQQPAFSFYDGPPFLSGAPHYGHILATAIKDAVTRFFTMRGYRVERRVGWDCHGLPVENIVEKELGFRSKRDIEKRGIAEFNAACRRSVLESEGKFRKMLERVGRFADYSRAYFTMDNSYIESVWWVFKQLWNLKLVYRDFAVVPYCPRCGTPLSSFEVDQGYKEVEDPSIFVKFEIKNSKNYNMKPKNRFLVWTTTPWTLPANAALAVNSGVRYVLVSAGGEKLILAKERLSVLGGKYKILKEFKGKDLIGTEYRPLYEIGGGQLTADCYKVFPADFVSTEEGTGIVHIAPAFGKDDMSLGKKHRLPLILTVDGDGRFNERVERWRGMFVKDADSEVIKDLKSRGFLYRSERAAHNYPFCWRCDSPLLYYPTSAWYVAISKIRKSLVKNNKKINWVPAHLKMGRFGKGLQAAPDWAFSRNRFWGAPLPIWECGGCGRAEAVGSLRELSRFAVSSGNNYFVMRHGEADSNVSGIISSRLEDKVRLTARGKKQTKEAAKKLRSKKIDVIFSSDFSRAKETAEILSGELKAPVHFDWQLREYNLGRFSGRPIGRFYRFIGKEINKFTSFPEGGETLTEVKGRMVSFLKETNRAWRGKNILIVSHGDPLWVLEGAALGISNEEIVKARDNYIKVGEWRKIDFLNLPYNERGEVDFHRPFIDDLVLKCPACRGVLKRSVEVFDCWFESGAMPYASWHYPFENKKTVERSFPADFIAEGLDQTRGWFYTLHVLATSLTLKNIGLGKDRPAFKNVVVNGLILDEYGRKLSKKLKNYTEPDVIVEKFGADSLRLFLLASTPIGEDYRFSDKGVEEMAKRVIDKLKNALNFYNLYAQKSAKRPLKAKNVLDRWITARLSETTIAVTERMERYDLTAAARLLIDFTDDLSNWHIRRSRRRFQRPENSFSRSDWEDASAVLRIVLTEISKLFAPFAPFIAEILHLSLLQKPSSESVHLENWPAFVKTSAGKPKIDKKLLEAMAETRKICSLGLEARQKAGIKVRQPLASLKIRNRKSVIKNNEEVLRLIKDEINVKEIIFDGTIEGETELNVKITPELKEEGMIREFIRSVQGLRADAGCKMKDKIILFAEAGGDLKKALVKNSETLGKETGAKSIEFKKSAKFDAEAEGRIDGSGIWLAVKKI